MARMCDAQSVAVPAKDPVAVKRRIGYTRALYGRHTAERD
jgi:hypothetical protein